MIKLYTDYRQCIRKVDAYFDMNISLKDFDDRCIEYMREIDHAEIINAEEEVVKTPFGVCSKEHLSTGLKVLVIVYTLIKKGKTAFVCIDECGVNVIKIIFEIANKQTNSDVSLVLHHTCFSKDKDYEFLLNGKTFCKNTATLMWSL